jgi:sugar transferase (PEP-CTERM/EpsH1 system associated)
MNWLYAREGRHLLSYDRKVSAEFDTSIFVTEEEADLFKQIAPEVSNKVTHINNGVDTEFFSPNHHYDNPYKVNHKIFVFTGAMDYWANIDAVSWYAHEIHPEIRKRDSNARFYIVGARPSDDVLKLEQINGVHVVGAVKDMRPYLHYAIAAVAPLRIARGLQNKILEAMAMAKPVIATPAAMAGISENDIFHSLVSDDAGMLVQFAINLIRDGDSQGIGKSGRDYVMQEFAWACKLKKFELLLEQQPESDR